MPTTTPATHVHHHRSPWPIRLLNKIPMLLLGSPLHGLMSRRALLLAFTGRKSGKRYRVPISYVPVGQTLLLTTKSPWWKNVHGGASVSLRLRGQECPAVAEVVTDAPAMAERYQIMLPKNPLQRRLLRIRLGQDGQPDVGDRRRALCDGAAVVGLHLN